MRSVTRLMIIALLGLSLALPAISMVSAPPASADSAVAQPTAPPSTTAPPTSGAGTIEKLNPEQEADKAEQRRKLIMGVTSVVLVGLVIWGRSIRRKRRKAAEGG